MHSSIRLIAMDSGMECVLDLCGRAAEHHETPAARNRFYRGPASAPGAARAPRVVRAYADMQCNVRYPRAALDRALIERAPNPGIQRLRRQLRHGEQQPTQNGRELSRAVAHV